MTQTKENTVKSAQSGAGEVSFSSQRDRNKVFVVSTKRGVNRTVIIRQMAHDPQYKIGSRIPRCGVVIAVADIAGGSL